MQPSQRQQMLVEECLDKQVPLPFNPLLKGCTSTCVHNIERHLLHIFWNFSHGLSPRPKELTITGSSHWVLGVGPFKDCPSSLLPMRFSLTTISATSLCWVFEHRQRGLWSPYYSLQVPRDGLQPELPAVDLCYYPINHRMKLKVVFFDLSSNQLQLHLLLERPGPGCGVCHRSRGYWTKLRSV